MTPLGLKLRPGESIFDQLVSAAQKAILSRELTEGQDYEGWLEMRPGLGTVVAPAPHKLDDMRRQLMQQEIARLVAEARRVGLVLTDLFDAIHAEWTKAVDSVEATR